VLVLVLGAAHPGHAQSTSDILGFLITSQSVQTGSVERDRAAAEATRTAIAQSLRSNLSTLPVGSSSGAFIYRLNPTLGTVERTTQTFGPLFVDRALTIGRNMASIGMSFQHFRFTALDGRTLGDGSLVTLANRFTDEEAPFDVDQLTLNLDADITTLSGQYGVTDGLEIALTLPVVVLRAAGSRINLYRGRTFTQATAEATTLGLADAVVRTKYAFYRSERRAVAMAADFRVPTGRSDDLLGEGTKAVKLSGIFSNEGGRVSTHASGGWTFWGLGDEFSYAAAITVAAPNRLTWAAELFGRSSNGLGHITAVSAPHTTLAGVETIRLQPDNARLYTLMFTPGVKWNLTDTWVITAGVTLPLSKNGLTTSFAPIFGVDYGL